MELKICPLCKKEIEKDGICLTRHTSPAIFYHAECLRQSSIRVNGYGLQLQGGIRNGDTKGNKDI